MYLCVIRVVCTHIVILMKFLVYICMSVCTYMIRILIAAELNTHITHT